MCRGGGWSSGLFVEPGWGCVPPLPRAQAPAHLVIRKLCRVATHSGPRSLPSSRPCWFMGYYTLFPTCLDVNLSSRHKPHGRCPRTGRAVTWTCSVVSGEFGSVHFLIPCRVLHRTGPHPPSELRPDVNRVASCALAYISVAFFFFKFGDFFFFSPHFMPPGEHSASPSSFLGRMLTGGLRAPPPTSPFSDICIQQHKSL